MINLSKEPISREVAQKPSLDIFKRAVGLL